VAHWQQSLLPLSLERRAGRMVMQWVHPAKGGSNGLEIDVSPGNHASVVRSDAFFAADSRAAAISSGRGFQILCALALVTKKEGIMSIFGMCK